MVELWNRPEIQPFHLATERVQRPRRRIAKINLGKNGDVVQIGHRIPPKQKNNKKTQKKNTVFQVNSGTVYRIFFLVWLFCSSMCLFAYHCITFKSMCLLYSFSSVIYDSKSTFNKPSREVIGSLITLRQSLEPHVMGIKE